MAKDDGGLGLLGLIGHRFPTELEREDIPGHGLEPHLDLTLPGFLSPGLLGGL